MVSTHVGSDNSQATLTSLLPCSHLSSDPFYVPLLLDTSFIRDMGHLRHARTQGFRRHSDASRLSPHVFAARVPNKVKGTGEPRLLSSNV